MTSSKGITIDKKKNGVFYTPYKVARILSEWAITSPQDRILEPSFGSCHFIEASKKHLLTLSCLSPEKQLYGCDIDQKAFTFLSEILDVKNLNGSFLKRDFLKLCADDFYGGPDMGSAPLTENERQELAELVARSIKGDEQATASLVEKSKNRLFRFCFYLCQLRDSAVVGGALSHHPAGLSL